MEKQYRVTLDADNGSCLFTLVMAHSEVEARELGRQKLQQQHPDLDLEPYWVSSAYESAETDSEPC